MIEPSEVQGLVASGYGGLPAMTGWLLEILDGREARHWIRSMSDRWAFIGQRDATRLHIAFTYAGLEALGGPTEGWEPAFAEGMVTGHRSRILGDVGPNHPDQWRWGGPRNRPVHALVLFYAKDRASLGALEESVRPEGMRRIMRLTSSALENRREHFGFRDGIENPAPVGLGLSRTGDYLPAGEIVLGEVDASGFVEPCPSVAHGSSFLVWRQLVQDVEAFWGAWTGPDAISLASKLIGREPDGRALAQVGGAASSFDYTDDPLGRRCPLGAHIRRARPRGSFGRPEDGRHRLLRRGRPWGTPVAAEVYPEGVEPVKEVEPGEPTDQRGLHFLALGASLGRQFEFVQQTWLNNPKFMRLWDEVDPLTHAPGHGSFTIPTDGLRRRCTGLPAFVRVIGGAYFVLPGRRLLDALGGGDAA